MRKFRIYDNGGKSCDRYTFVIREKDSSELQFWSSSENPSHPQGFGQYCGSSSDGYHAGRHLGAKVREFSELPYIARAYFADCAKSCGWSDFQIDRETLA